MTTANAPGPDVPRPVPSEHSAPFWEACVEGRFLFQRCETGHVVFPPEVGCTSCLSPDLHWEQASGEGSIHSFTVVWRAPTEAFIAPYVVAVVRGDEGYYVASNIVGCEVEDVAVDQRVQVMFIDTGGGFVIPAFTPAPDPDPEKRP